MLSRKDLTRMIWRYANTSPDGWFGYHLGLRLAEFGGTLDIRRVDALESEVATTVPKGMCNPDGRVCLAAAVALADEVSTFAGVVPWDKRCRPGASVQLSAQAYRPLDVAAGEQLVFGTKKVKMGANLAYVDVNIFNASGTRLAFVKVLTGPRCLQLEREH
ncbi:MAG: hypothetical protein ACPIOQ_10210 [Promethearchaeia archaeon]